MRAAPAVAPVEFIDGLPVVSVGLGAVKADFLVDTGGRIGLTVPAPLINGATKVTVRDDYQKTGDAAGKTFSVQKLTAESVVVGGTELGPVEGLVHYTWGLLIGPGNAPAVTQKGVIGFAALSKRNVLFDFARRQLLLYERRVQDGPDPDRPNVSDWEQVPFEYDARGVVVKVQLNGIDASLALDTAATASMIKKDAAIFQKTPSPCKRKSTQDQLCGMLHLPNATASGGKLGRMQLAVVQMGDIPFDGLIGADFFQSRRVFVDFDAKLLYVDQVKPVRVR